MNLESEMEAVLNLLNAHPWAWLVVTYVAGVVVNEALSWANGRWPDSKLVDFLTEQAHAALSALPGHIKSQRERAKEKLP